jgi:hypothetical protein
VCGDRVNVVCLVWITLRVILHFEVIYGSGIILSY